MACSDEAITEDKIYEFDARGISCRVRHAAIFGALESLSDGEVMRFANDHDPLPLLQQISHRYGPQVQVNYVSREPGNIVIDFRISLEALTPEMREAAGGGGGCGGGGGSGCCSH